MAGQLGVVRLDVQLEVFVQAIGFQKPDHRLSVVVILMTRRLLGFGLDQKLSREADFLGVRDCHMKKLC